MHFIGFGLSIVCSASCLFHCFGYAHALLHALLFIFLRLSSLSYAIVVCELYCSFHVNFFAFLFVSFPNILPLTFFSRLPYQLSSCSSVGTIVFFFRELVIVSSLPVRSYIRTLFLYFCPKPSRYSSVLLLLLPS